MKRRLLITGASGYLGWNLCNEASCKWQVFGISNKNSINLYNIIKIKTDLTNTRSLQTIFQDLKPEAVIHAAAYTLPNFCQLHPEETYRLNVEATYNIARFCSERKIPLVFVSSDLVFDGLNPPYSEDSPVNPTCIYGKQKQKAEERILEIFPEAAVCRLPLLFGHTGSSNQGFYQHAIREMKAGKQVKLFVDEFRTPVDCKSASAGLLMALETIHGIIHLGGRKRFSRYQLGMKLAQLAGCDPSLIEPIQIKDLPMAAPRSPDVSLNSEKAFSLGYNPTSILEPMKKAIHFDTNP